MTDYKLTAQDIKLAHIEHPKVAKWYNEYLASPEWAVIRVRLKDRAKDRCEKCYPLEPVGNLCAHHLTYERVTQEDISDLLLVCEACHSFLHDRCIIPYAERIYDENYKPLTNTNTNTDTKSNLNRKTKTKTKGKE